jgi:glc operon protein GlcG
MNKLPTKPVLTLEVAKAMLAASEVKARELGLAMTIAVVDDGGHPLALSRMDGIHAGTVEIAFAKAKSSVMFKRPTGKFGEGVAAGSIGLIALPNVVPFAGGLPLMSGTNLVGAVGASGASPDKDEAVAAAGVAVFENALKA